MPIRYSIAVVLFLVLLPVRPTSAQSTAPASGPATAPLSGDGALKIIVSAVEGKVEYRQTSEQPWAPVKAGLQLDEGCEFRTGLKSSVKCVIAPDQTFTVDRLGVVKVLRSAIENGTIKTDIGMKYGRTRYDIEAADRAHDAKVRSPSSVLAVRGTRVSLYDQPPFAPMAVSLTGRASFRDLKKQVAFGGKGQGKTTVDANTADAAAYGIEQTRDDPKGKFSARTNAEQILQIALNSNRGNDMNSIGVFSLIADGKFDAFKGSLIGTVFIEQTLDFSVFWTSKSRPSDVNLFVTTPTGETISKFNPTTADGLGIFQGDGFIPAGSNEGFSEERVSFLLRFPSGKYTVTTSMAAGADAATSVDVVQVDRTTREERRIPTVNTDLTSGSPTNTFTVDVPLPAGDGATNRAASSAGTSTKKKKKR